MTVAPLADEPAIQFSGVDAHYNRTLALNKIDLSIEPGTVTAVIGPNGSGKSTLFGVISGRVQPSAGSVTTVGPVAEVLQATAIDDQLRLTVDDIVRIGRYSGLGLLRRIRRVDNDAIDEALDRVDLLDMRRRPINELSGGQRQRALIAQGIAQEAPLLVLDEPANGLDAPSQRHILDIIRAEAEGGRTVLFSTHQLAEASHADMVIALSCSCVCCAPPADAMVDPVVTALFA